jgi:hypothetical protein
MARKQDINPGAGAACVTVDVIVGLATQSLSGGLIAFVGLAGVLAALRPLTASIMTNKNSAYSWSMADMGRP